MGIFKETLPDYLKNQIRIREKILQTGNNPTEGRSITQLSTDDYDTKLPQGAFHTWGLNKSCTIRMASCVDLIDDDILEISKNNPAINRLAEKDLLGPGLSLAYILEGGTIIKGAKQARVKNDKGGYETSVSFYGSTLGPLIVNKIINDHNGKIEFIPINYGAKININFNLNDS